MQKNKKFIISFLAIIIVALTVFVSASNSCEDSQTILKLSDPFFGIIGLSSSDFQTSICYNEIFDEEFEGENVHQCNGNNTVLTLTSGEDLCYGDLSCSNTQSSCQEGEFKIISTDNQRLGQIPGFVIPEILNFTYNISSEYQTNSKTDEAGCLYEPSCPIFTNAVYRAKSVFIHNECTRTATGTHWTYKDSKTHVLTNLQQEEITQISGTALKKVVTCLNGREIIEPEDKGFCEKGALTYTKLSDISAEYKCNAAIDGNSGAFINYICAIPQCNKIPIIEKTELTLQGSARTEETNLGNIPDNLISVHENIFKINSNNKFVNLFFSDTLTQETLNETANIIARNTQTVFQNNICCTSQNLPPTNKDITPPEITNIQTNPNLPFTNNGQEQDISIDFDSSEFPISIIFNLYNSTNSTISTQGPINLQSENDLPIIFTIPKGLKENTYFLYLAVTDSSSNEATFLVGYFNVIKPIQESLFLDIISPTNNTTLNNSDVLIELSTNANSTTFFNGIITETYTNPITKTFSEGSHTLVFTSILEDQVLTKSITFTINTSTSGGSGGGSSSGGSGSSRDRKLTLNNPGESITVRDLSLNFAEQPLVLESNQEQTNPQNYLRLVLFILFILIIIATIIILLALIIKS